MTDHTSTQSPENEDLGPYRDPYDRLTDLQGLIYAYLLARPFDGACRRDFAADLDVYEISNRIGEIEARLGITIERERCRIHKHRTAFVRYRL